MVPVLGEILREYFNDFLATILLGASVQVILILLFKAFLKGKTLLMITIVAAVVWEYLAPLYKPSAEFRYLDFVAYALGSLLYFILLQWYIKKIHHNFNEEIIYIE